MNPITDVRHKFEWLTSIILDDVSVIVNSFKEKIIPETAAQGLRLGWQLVERKQVVALGNHPSLLEISVACFRQGSNLNMQKVQQKT
jgi:hypothetical protein